MLAYLSVVLNYCALCVPTQQHGSRNIDNVVYRDYFSSLNGMSVYVGLKVIQTTSASLDGECILCILMCGAPIGKHASGINVNDIYLQLHATTWFVA